MQNENSQQTLHTAFLALPRRIKDWLASDQITFLLREITDRLGLSENKVAKISKLILRLIVQDLELLEFINELAHELDTSFQTAKTIAQDIEMKVLKPIENDLRKEIGIDLKLIYFGKPSAQKAESKLQVPEDAERVKANAPTIATPMSLPESPIPKPTSLSGPTEWEKLRQKTAPPPIPKKIEEKISKHKEPSVDLQSFEFKTDAPFILHQEGQYSTASSSELPKAKPSLNVKVQDYYQSEQEIKKPVSKPTAIKLETPQNSNSQQQSRVVNYVGPTTKLNNLGLPKIPDQNTVDLRKFIKPYENGGNTVDLRQK